MTPSEHNISFRKQFLNRVLLGILIFLIFFNFPFLCGGHGHSHEDGHMSGHGHSHDHEIKEPPSFKYSKQANVKSQHSSDSESSNETRDVFNLWIEALGSTLLISAAPFFILFLVPLDNSKEKEPLLKLLLSFASGGLLGDAFLHLIPHALAPHSHEKDDSDESVHSHSHSHEHGGHGHDMSVGLWVLCGILTFLVVEKFVRLVKGGHGHSHSSVTEKAVPNKKDKVSDSEGEEDEDISRKLAQDGDGSTPKGTTKEKMEVEIHEDIKVAGYLNLAADFTHNFTDGLAIGASYLAGRNIGIITTVTILLHEVPHEIGDFAILIQSGCSRKKAMLLQLTTAVGALTGTVVSLCADGFEDIKVAGYLNLAADFTHNFTDGLAIGASYLAGRNIGIITTVTILLHEVPHEIGDFAILIQSGCSRKKAMLLQLTTAVGALTGTVVSLCADGFDAAATAWILPFTAGGFIYIATVSVIPELLVDTKLWQSVREIIALLVGVYMMVLIAQYE
uniref:Uncharacterized protein n=1 Tax=Homalodisca liturata TaxID=320908 RepID=A0A1B6ILE0_9HEMI